MSLTPSRLVLVLALASAFAAAAPASAAADKVKPPPLDPNRIINESFNFLREREPEMTAEEYALYERVIPMARDRPEFALKLLETMVADEKEESPAFEFALANVYYMHDRHAEAEARFKKAIERYPNYQRAWLCLGTLYYVTSRFEEAVECYAKSVALGDREAQTLGLLGYALYRTGNPIAAEMAYMQAMAADPGNPDWIGAVVNLLIENREHARAEPLARRLVKVRPKEAGSWNLLAGVLAALGRKSDACAQLELASTLGAADSDGLALLGDLYFEQGLLAEAADVYRRLGAVSPGLGAARQLTCVQAAIAAGKPADAARVFATIPAPGGGDERARYLQVRAQLRLAEDDAEAARRDLIEVLKLQPLHGWALVTLGDSYRDAGDEARAEFYFNEATRVAEYAYRAHLELANSALRAHRFAASVTHLEAALALEKSPELQRHLAQVRLLVETP